MSGEADSKFVWMNGELKPFQDANVHVLSHSLHYGSAAFEGIRAYKTKSGQTAIYRAKEHIDRFEQSMNVFGGTCAYSNKQLIDAMGQVIRANAFDECYLRPLGYIGHDSRGLKLPPSPKMQVAIASWKWGKYLGNDAMNKGIKCNVASFRRPDVASSLPWAKLSGNYLNSIMARREATLAGVDEAILLDQNGYVAEGSGENIFLVEKGVLSTPPPNAILPGITRDSIFQLAKLAGYQVKERDVTRNQLYAADEVFFTGTAAEVTPISLIDGRKIGAGEPGPVTKKLADLFEKSIRGELPETKHWLHFV